MSDVDSPNEFEARRLANIRENQETLERLGLGGGNVLQIQPANLKTAREITERPKKRARTTTSTRSSRAATTTVGPTRKSRRIAASSGIIGDKGGDTDESEASTTNTRPVQIRRLSPIPVPSIHMPAEGYPADFIAPPPTRDPGEPELESIGIVGGTIRFERESHFTPNLTPSEMMRLGSFGGTFFRAFHSSILHANVNEDFDEFPPDWYDGIDTDQLLTLDDYDPSINRYGVKAGQSLADWEKSGWIRAQDPRGWFQWYCRFYLGRRSADDDRQISRWSGVCGRNGRFKKALVKKVLASGGRDKWNDESVAPVLRQTLQHWGYILTEADYLALITQ